jgi:hypothetical protein
MMVAVAIVGIALQTTVLVFRSREYRRLAERYRQLESNTLGIAERYGVHAEVYRGYGRIDMAKDAERGAAESRLWHTHHHSLRLKYDRASRYPWLPVAPDPPEPE